MAAVNGVATFGNLSINKTGTGYTLTAADGALSGGVSTAFNVTAAAASKVAFTTQPVSTAAGASVTPAVQVSIEDANGNVVTGNNSNVTVALGTNPSGGALSGTLTVAAVNGVATFSTLSINKLGTGYTLTAADGSLNGATSTSFNVVAPAASKLVFTVQPAGTAVGASIAPAVQVSVEDANGNVVAGDTSSVTIALGTNPSGGVLSGTLTVAAVNGVATFGNLSINKTGTGYTLTAAGSLSGAASTAFNVEVTPPGNLGAFSGGYWYRDMNGDNQWTTADGSPVAFAPAGATPVVGDWDGSGKTELGYYLNGTWYLQTSTGVEQFTFGFTGSNVIPVVGDWNGGGKTEVGVYANGAWFRDMDNSHTWDATNQASLAYLGWNDGGTDTVIPVPGYWAGDGKTEMGVYCKGVWFLDSTGTGKYNGTYSYWGWNASLIPVVGDWNHTGIKDQFGVFNQGVWFRDADGTHQWDAANQAAVAYFGWTGAQPVVGDWYSYATGAAAQADSLAAAVSLASQAAAASLTGVASQFQSLSADQADAAPAQAADSVLMLAPAGGSEALAPSSGTSDDAAPPAVPSAASRSAAINPGAVDRIDLAAAVQQALGQGIRNALVENVR